MPKPSYLFAVVAGKLVCNETTFTTKSGRPLSIKFYVPAADTKKCEFAHEALKAALRWDERTYGLGA